MREQVVRETVGRICSRIEAASDVAHRVPRKRTDLHERPAQPGADLGGQREAIMRRLGGAKLYDATRGAGGEQEQQRRAAPRRAARGHD